MGMGRSRCLVQQNNSAYHNCWRFTAVFSVVLNIIFIIIVLAQHRQQSRGLDSPTPCSCPSDWLLHKGTCYYFSTEERNWTRSRDFCSSYNASLATIENEEKIFVMRYGTEPPYWIGLTKCAGQPWKWLNGQNTTLKVLGEGENCAYLRDKEAIISRCGTEHRWICTKSINATDA